MSTTTQPPEAATPDSPDEPSPMASATIDPDRQATAREYEHRKRKLSLVGTLLSFVYAGLWLAMGVSLPLLAWLNDAMPGWVAFVAFIAIFGGVYTLISMPLDYISGYKLEHAYGMSRQSVGGWLKDEALGFAIGGVLIVGMLAVLYWLMAAMPDWWWLAMAGVFVAFSVLATFVAPVLIAPLFYKFEPLDEEQHAELIRRLKELGEANGVHVKGVYRFDMSSKTVKANAALAGIGSTRRIILGDTLLEHFSIEEIEAVMAHEMAHHVHKDIPKMIALAAVLMPLGLGLAAIVLNAAAESMGLASPATVATLPVLAIIAGLWGLVVSPVQSGFSRWREFLADGFAARVTGRPDAMASALKRLANQNLADVDPPRWVETLFHSHPSLKRRIEALGQPL